MTKLFSLGLFAIMLCGCSNDVHDQQTIKEGVSLKSVVLEVGEDLRALGFPVDCEKINIEVREANEMAALFNAISDESRQQVNNYTPFGPLKRNGADDKQGNSRLAFYDPNSKTIVFKKNTLHKLTKGYLAHELAHAYQDQKWGFDTIWQTYNEKPTREAFNVTQFIIEGHAELVRHAYEQNHVAPHDAKEMSVSLGQMSENDCIPCHTKQSLSTLPYVFGMRFLVNQYRSGGWPKVESFFTDLPSSTEQIIHEDKYEKDTPTNISLPVWNDEAYGVEPILNGSLGEAFLLAKLLSLPIPAEKAFRSASGWDGDVAQLYQLHDGREALLWRIAFDRIYDAKQFEDAIKGNVDDSYLLRMGKVVDFIITKHPDLHRKISLYLSKHRMAYQGNFDDEQSTTAQEVSIQNDAVLFDNPRFIPKIVIGPNL